MPYSPPQAHPELPEPSKADAALLRSYKYFLASEDHLGEVTRGKYLDAARLHARWFAKHTDHDLDEADRDDFRAFMIWMREEALKRNGEPYSPGYRNYLFRSLQPFYKWLSVEEDGPNPMIGLKPPKPQEKVVPVVSREHLRELLNRYEKKKDFYSRRNLALIHMFIFTGGRIAELTQLTVDNINLENRTATIMGKGGKERTVRFDTGTRKVLDKYIRTRVKHSLSELPNLWLGDNNRVPLTPNGVRQCLRRAAAEFGFHLKPHQLRHSFAHYWLDEGHAEGDLMELMGWSSPQMLRRYGKSASAARARRSYDRFRLLGDEERNGDGRGR